MRYDVKIGESNFQDYAWSHVGDENLSVERREEIGNRLLQEIWEDKSLNDVELLLTVENLPPSVFDRAEAMQGQLKKYYEMMKAFASGNAHAISEMLRQEELCEELESTARTCLKILGNPFEEDKKRAFLIFRRGRTPKIRARIKNTTQ